MYLHLGSDIIVKYADIVGVFDIENTSISKITKEYLATSEKEKRVINVSYDMPKSFVVCENEDGTKVYISHISCSTLRKRQNYLNTIKK